MQVLISYTLGGYCDIGPWTMMLMCLLLVRAVAAPFGAIINLANGTESIKYWLAHPEAGEASFDTLKDRRTIYTGDNQSWPWYGLINSSQSSPPIKLLGPLLNIPLSFPSTIPHPFSKASERTIFLGWFEQARPSDGLRRSLPIRVSMCKRWCLQLTTADLFFSARTHRA